MATIKRAYDRSFQAVFNLGARCLRWRRPIPVTGPVLYDEARCEAVIRRIIAEA